MVNFVRYKAKKVRLTIELSTIYSIMHYEMLGSHKFPE